ncbi:MAG: DNA polymerase III subunit gamma/tau, partial [Lachnospiraceae bacterium]|nr:DNA polymerase III subunit gamma/tau [Lachnospiraceae bacterium]
VFSDLLRNVLDRNVLGCVTLLEEIVMQGRELTQFVTDFTWYLRNLMLVQASDNLEDVIDVSSDNLARLKEEAQSVSFDQVCRYIHVFSNLAGQIKYSNQKRILVEIALIKLCKPEMEQSSEAVLDRIRQVEERVEQAEAGAFTRVVTVASAEGTAPVSAAAKPKLEKAVPEEIQGIVRNWMSIVGNAPSGMMQVHLKGAKLSLGADNQLIVALKDGVAFDYFNGHPENMNDLVRLIEDSCGKEVSVLLRSYQDEVDFENHFVDLKEVIQMEIEEEEE